MKCSGGAQLTVSPMHLCHCSENWWALQTQNPDVSGHTTGWQAALFVQNGEPSRAQDLQEDVCRDLGFRIRAGVASGSLPWRGHSRPVLREQQWLSRGSGGFRGLSDTQLLSLGMCFSTQREVGGGGVEKGGRTVSQTLAC